MTRKQIITAEDVREMKKLLESRMIASLDAQISDENEGSLGDFIVDDSAKSPEEEALLANMTEIVHQVLNSLPDREQKVLRMRYGIGIPQPMTMEKVGEHFGISRERVRQIENNAMKTLRHPSRMSKMRVYSEDF